MKILELLLLLFALMARSYGASDAVEKAAINYHNVGWFNTFVPGGGEILLGNYGTGALEASIEVSTFVVGYEISKNTRFTLDGVSTEVPRRLHETENYSKTDRSRSDISRDLCADILQEFGLKYHMTNVFNSYRKAAAGTDSRIDETSTKDLFLAPFKKEILEDPWVYGGIASSFIAVFVNYFTGPREHVSRITGTSNSLFAFNYLAVYPIGSAAPEEMFYHGFLQNELYRISPSPYFSIPATSVIYGLSHSPDDYFIATVTGAYAGYLTQRDQGKLSKAIAYHFWSDLAAGVMTTLMLQRDQKDFRFGFSFKY